MKRTVFSLVALAATALPTTAFAHRGPPVDVFTSTVADVDVIAFEGPCGGGAGEATIEYRNTFHVTGFEDGHAAVAGNERGSFTFEPDDPSQPSSAGHYVNRFRDTFVQNGGGFTSVFSVVGHTDDGELIRFKVREQFVFANGEVRVQNFSVSC